MWEWEAVRTAAGRDREPETALPDSQRVKTPDRGGPVKLLFVCSRNRLRSPTAEAVFDGLDGHQARSAGTEPGARVRVTAGMIGWADVIFVMEKRHLARLRDRFGDVLDGKRVVCLRVPDDYAFMDEELVGRLREAVAPHLTPDG